LLSPGDSSLSRHKTACNINPYALLPGNDPKLDSDHDWCSSQPSKRNKANSFKLSQPLTYIDVK